MLTEFLFLLCCWLPHGCYQINTSLWKMISYNCLANCSDAVNSFLTCFYQTDTRLKTKWTIPTLKRYKIKTSNEQYSLGLDLQWSLGSLWFYISSLAPGGIQSPRENIATRSFVSSKVEGNMQIVKFWLNTPPESWWCLKQIASLDLQKPCNSVFLKNEKHTTFTSHNFIHSFLENKTRNFYFFFNKNFVGI